MKIRKDRRIDIHIDLDLDELVPEIFLFIMVAVLAMLLGLFLFLIYATVTLIISPVFAFAIAGVVFICSLVFSIVLIKNSLYFLDETCIWGITLLMANIFGCLYLFFFM